MYPKELKHFNLVCLSLYRIPETKTNWPKAFLGKKVCRNTENHLSFVQVIFWNFQILPAVWLKNNLHRFRGIFCVSHFPFLPDAETYSEPFETYFKHKMVLFAKIAIDYFGKKLHLRCLIGNVSRYTSPDPRFPYCWRRVNSSWLKTIETVVRRCSSK